MSELSLPQVIVVSILPVLFAITVHEVAHGWVAAVLHRPHGAASGQTHTQSLQAHRNRRHSADPGTVAAARAGFLFGWAKPVPVTWENLRHPKRDKYSVAIAGPVANLLMARFSGVRLPGSLPCCWRRPTGRRCRCNSRQNAVSTSGDAAMVPGSLKMGRSTAGAWPWGPLPGPLAWQLSLALID